MNPEPEQRSGVDAAPATAVSAAGRTSTWFVPVMVQRTGLSTYLRISKAHLMRDCRQFYMTGGKRTVVELDESIARQVYPGIELCRVCEPFARLHQTPELAVAFHRSQPAADTAVADAASNHEASV